MTGRAFPVRHAADKVPTVMVRVQDIANGRETVLPVSLSIRYPGKASWRGRQYFKQPIGQERCASWQMVPGGSIVSLKGAGQRDPLNSYFDRIGTSLAPAHPDILKPFDINEDDFASGPQLLLGGGNVRALQGEAVRHRTFAAMAHTLSASTAGFQIPIAIYEILEFPVIHANGGVTLVSGENYFMNTAYMSLVQRKAVLRYVEKNGSSARQKSQATAALATLNATAENLTLAADTQLAAAFIESYRPAIYMFKGELGPRIGHLHRAATNSDGTLRDLLVERGHIDEGSIYDTSGRRKRRQKEGGILDPRFDVAPVDPDIGLAGASTAAIKTALDELVTGLYSSADLLLNLPSATPQDLYTSDGRYAYLKEIRALNGPAARTLTDRLVQATAQQLGTIHGSGGHVGGSAALAHMGFLLLTYRGRFGRKTALEMFLSPNRPPTVNWRGKSGKPMDDPRTLVEVASCPDTHFREMGPDGGGSTRDDNLGVFGLRDFDTHRYSCDDPAIDRLLSYHPTVATEQERDARLIWHHYLILKQQLDLSLLFMAKPRLGLNTPGSFMTFVGLTGGNLADYLRLRKDFFAAYRRWYQQAQQALAPDWFKNLRVTREKVTKAGNVHLTFKDCASGQTFAHDFELHTFGDMEYRFARKIFSPHLET